MGSETRKLGFLNEYIDHCKAPYKRTQQLLRVAGSADVGWCWQLCANGRNNSQHYWALLVLQMLDGVSSCVQMDETTPNIIGSCWFCRCWMVLAVV